MAYYSRASRKKSRNGGSELDARIAALKQDFDSLQHDMRELLGSLGQEASDRVSRVTEQAGEVASSAAEQVETFAEEGTETVREAIKAQPFAAIALSMGAGALIGTLLRR